MSKKKIVHCKSIWSKFLGLMFSKYQPDLYYLFYNEKCLHGFFMRYHLYIIVADEQRKIIAKFVLYPWHISKYYFKAKYILETTDVVYWQKQQLGELLKI